MTEDAMIEGSLDEADIRPSDIVFDCPNCGKSLAIDYRGAGLVIPCTDCGERVQVPIPEGMEVGDVDSSDEDKELHLVSLRKSLTAAEQRISQLENEVADLMARNEALEKSRTGNMYRVAAALEQADKMQKAMEDIVKQLNGMSALEVAGVNIISGSDSDAAV